MNERKELKGIGYLPKKGWERRESLEEEAKGKKNLLFLIDCWNKILGFGYYETYKAQFEGQLICLNI
jgi:hypothetical protein